MKYLEYRRILDDQIEILDLEDLGKGEDFKSLSSTIIKLEAIVHRYMLEKEDDYLYNTYSVIVREYQCFFLFPYPLSSAIHRNYIKHHISRMKLRLSVPDDS